MMVWNQSECGYDKFDPWLLRLGFLEANEARLRFQWQFRDSGQGWAVLQFAEAAFKSCCDATWFWWWIKLWWLVTKDATYVGGFWMNDWRPTSDEGGKKSAEHVCSVFMFCYAGLPPASFRSKFSIFSPQVSGMQSFHQTTHASTADWPQSADV